MSAVDAKATNFGLLYVQVTRVTRREVLLACSLPKDQSCSLALLAPQQIFRLATRISQPLMGMTFLWGSSWGMVCPALL